MLAQCAPVNEKRLASRHLEFTQFDDDGIADPSHTLSCP
jgi:hypothetical protein